MKKSKLKKSSNSRPSFKVKLSWLLIVVALFLGSSIYAAFSSGSGPLAGLFQSASINKIIVEDPNTAKTAAERKAINELNSAANQEARAVTDKQKTAAEARLDKAGNDLAKIEKSQEQKDKSVVSTGSTSNAGSTDTTGTTSNTSGSSYKGKGGDSCEGGSKGVKIPDGTWAASGKNMGTGSEDQRECVQCQNGAWKTKTACNVVYKEDPAKVILPPGAGSEYTDGKKTPKLGAGEHPDQGVTCDGSSCWSSNHKENCYDNSGVISTTGTQKGETRCFDGKWVTEAAFDTNMKDTCVDGKYDANTNKCLDKSATPPQPETKTPKTVVCISADGRKLAREYPEGTDCNKVTASSCKTGLTKLSGRDVYIECSVGGIPSYNFNVSHVGKECPKDYLSCSGFCDKNSEGKFASKPVGGKVVCDVPPAITVKSTKATTVTSTNPTQALMEARKQVYTTSQECMAKTGSLCKADPNDPKKFVFISYVPETKNQPSTQQNNTTNLSSPASPSDIITARQKVYEDYSECSGKTGGLCKVNPDGKGGYVFITYTPTPVTPPAKVPTTPKITLDLTASTVKSADACAGGKYTKLPGSTTSPTDVSYLCRADNGQYANPQTGLVLNGGWCSNKDQCDSGNCEKRGWLGVDIFAVDQCAPINGADKNSVINEDQTATPPIKVATITINPTSNDNKVEPFVPKVTLNRNTNAGKVCTRYDSFLGKVFATDSCDSVCPVDKGGYQPTLGKDVCGGRDIGYEIEVCKAAEKVGQASWDQKKLECTYK